jgi:hypothetical protein
VTTAYGVDHLKVLRYLANITLWDDIEEFVSGVELMQCFKECVRYDDMPKTYLGRIVTDAVGSPPEVVDGVRGYYAATLVAALERFAEAAHSPCRGCLRYVPTAEINLGSCKSCFRARKRNHDVLRQELLEAQGYRCAICPELIVERPNIDHDHFNGMVRGVLCTRCNIRMSAVDDEEWLTKAVAYRVMWKEAHASQDGLLY